MSARRSGYHVTTALTVAGLILAPVQSGWAQMYTPGPAAATPGTAPAIVPQQGATQVQNGDPPARVGRLGFVQGAVSFHTADEDHWEPATLNYPVSSGNAFWTEPSALARLEVDASTLWLDGGTEFDVNALDLRALQATQPQGEVYLHLRSLAQGDSVVVQTPRAVVTLQVNGRYAIAAGDTDHPTEVTVLDGTAQVTGPGVSLTVRAGQAATITGAQNFQGVIGPAQQDSFLAAMLRREQPPAPAVVAQAQSAPVSAPVIVQQMTGSDDLDQYGAWQEAPQYGRVWYPQVESGWVPYRHGHWAFVAPWGWTWVDDAPWGFAPFHYGRWVQVNDRWGWTPQAEGPDYRGGYGPPVYAPALVTFFGIGAAAAIGIGAAAAFSHGNVGWVPLGPREPYYPPYRVSDGYLRRVNGPGITNVTNIRQNYSNTTINNFVNRGAATFVPEDAMARSRPIAAARANVPQGDLGQFRPVGGRPVIAPTPATYGVTPTVAREMRFSAPPERQAAPGPSVNPAAFRAMPGRPGAAPPLRGLPANAQPQPQPQGLTPGMAPGGPRPEVQPNQAGRPVVPNQANSPDQANQLNQPGQPGLRPGETRPNGAPGPGLAPREAMPQTQGVPPGQVAPGQSRPGESRPEAAPGLPALRPSGPQGAVRPNLSAPLPQVSGPGGARPQEPGVRPQDQGPGVRPQDQAPGVRPQDQGPGMRQQDQGPGGRLPQLQRPGVPEPARPATPQQTSPQQPVAPRIEAPRVEAPRVEPPRVEAPRQVAPAARPEPPRQAPPSPRPEPPRPEPPRSEPPRVAPPAPRPEPARVEPPRPAPPPAPRPEPPRPAPPPAPRPEPPRPAPPPAPRPEPPHPAPPPPHRDDKKPQ